jgi:hypothetical protein
VSRGWKRYGEGRLYFIGASVGLLVVLWSVLSAQDHSARESQATAVAPVIETPAQPDSPAGQASAAQPVPAPAEAPQTRTRGS